MICGNRWIARPKLCWKAVADTVTPAVRSRMMSGIRAKDTKPELLVRRGLHRLGFRYRLHDRKLPGKPDLVFPSRNAVIQVNGCFWHGHDCSFFRLPATRTEFWQEKIEGNKARDRRNSNTLRESGWRIATVWECALRCKTADIDGAIKSLAEWLNSNQPDLCLRETP